MSQINLKTNLVTILVLALCNTSFAQIPAGYYDDATGKSGYTLKTSLYDIIKGHSDRGYRALWTLYETSDKRDDGFVWDIYSDCALEFITDQDPGSGGTVECDKFNREHTFPQSWFGGSGIMRNDPFHVLPTDKKVNSERGNFAYGEVSSPSYTSRNGSKKGANTIAGHSGTVFEPIDEYKGDIARGYFYMATRYENVISGWETNDSDGDAMLDGSTNQVYEDWALNMLLSWHNADSVSQKEIDRNDAIYDFQGNRNPFIDHPEYVSNVWGGRGTPVATISLTSSLTDFGTVSFGDVSSTQSYTISGANLTSDISVTSDNGFEVSLTDTYVDFGNNVMLAQTSGDVSITTIFVRFKPQSDLNTFVNDTITHTSNGASTEMINVSGSEYFEVIPEINFSFSLRNIDPIDQYEVQLFANVVPNEGLIISIEKTNGINLTYGTNYSTVPVLTNDVMELTWPTGEFTATFMINFETSLLDEVTPGDLDFTIKPSESYTIGSNSEFQLNLKSDVVAITNISENSLSSLIIFPNPVIDEVNIAWENHRYNYQITDLSRKILLIGDSNQSINIDMSKFKSGNYLLTIYNDKSTLTQRLFIY